MNPTPEEIKQARKKAKLTQRAAADLLYVRTNTWVNWERGVNNMSKANWELFNLKAF